MYMCIHKYQINVLRPKFLESQGHGEQGSPTPGPCTGIGLQPVRNQATEQEGSAASEASSVFIAAPRCSQDRPSPASCRIISSIRFSLERKPRCELRARGIWVAVP